MSFYTLPYWRLSSVYLFYFASLGVLMPYLGLYMKSLGFLPMQIGIAFAVLQGTKIVAPNIWGWIVDIKRNRLGMIRLAAFISFFSFTLIFLQNNFYYFVVIIFIFGFFWNAMLPQVEALTFSLMGAETRIYGRIRLWGSLGFVATVIISGLVIDNVGLYCWPFIVLVCLLFIVVSCLFIFDRKSKETKRQISFMTAVRKKSVVAFFTMVFLMEASHGPYYSFFSIFLNENHYNTTEVGLLWSLGVVAEIILFLLMHVILKFVSLRTLLLTSIALTFVRWLLIGWFIDELIILVIAQLLHAASFGAFHVVSIHLIHQYFKGGHQGRGQALYASVGFGAGGMLGSLMAGLLWESISARGVFFIASILSIIAFFVALNWVTTKGDANSVSTTKKITV